MYTLYTYSTYHYYLLFFVAAPVALPAPGYLTLPKLHGTYLCLIMCLICRFIVTTNNTIKYNNNIGQNTGILNISKNVINNAVIVAFVHAYQNLNSGTRLANGLCIHVRRDVEVCITLEHIQCNRRVSIAVHT